MALAALAAACATPEPEPPPDDPAPVDGVYGVAPGPVRSVPSVVTLTPTEPIDVAGPADPTIDQLGLQFSPRLLVVRVGEPTRFTNSESLAHNVHVRSIESGETVFNADTPSGEVLDFTFREAGAYDVLCDTHPGMSAVVFATEAPYAVFADGEGRFEMAGVEPGTYTLRVWSVDSDLRSEREVRVVPGAATEVAAAPVG